MSTPGHIELQRSLDSITVGKRQRDDLGDLDALAASIERHGLLQPITVTPDGVLVCGQRRLEAMKRLGIRSTNVWVRAGISDQLSHMLAQRDENLTHKPLSLTESANLYDELRKLFAEDAARRQKATRFGNDEAGDEADGPANVAAPPITGLGDARAQAAKFVTGRSAYTTLDRVLELQRIADDEDADPALRATARSALRAIDDGAPVMPAIRRITEQQPAVVDATARSPGVDPLEVDAALLTSRPEESSEPERPETLPTRMFVYVWNDLDQWWTRYDVDQVAAELTDDDWTRFEATVAGTVDFAGRLRSARSTVDELRV